MTESTVSAITNRLQKNFKVKSKVAKRENIQAWRLYDRDIPEFPYIVDLYGDQILIYDKSDDEIDADKVENFEALIASLEHMFQKSPEQMTIKRRKIQERHDKYQKFSGNPNPVGEFEVQEKQAKLIVNLEDYLDTGLFLDHRPLRQMVFKEAKEKKVLNLFSYTGAIGVFAALGGAKSVVNVDLSNTYQEWAERNFKLNGLIDGSKYRFIIADVLKYCDQIKDQFDLIILDPPTFSNSKKMFDVFDVQDDHYELITKLLKHLAPGGTFYFSNNRRKFKLDARLNQFEDITKITIPFDFHDQKIHHCYRMKS